MIEAIVTSLIVAFAAMHVTFRLSPKLVQQKLHGVMAAGLSKIGLDSVAQRLVSVRQVEDKACGSGCGGCGAQTTTGDEIKADGGVKVVQVVQFHPRLR
jgi:hypothetical protein